MSQITVFFSDTVRKKDFAVRLRKNSRVQIETGQQSDFSMISLNFPKLRNAENPAFYGHIFDPSQELFPVFKQHEIFVPKLKFYDISMTSAIFPKIHDFFRSENCIFMRFLDFS